jgi:prepilin-type N-terminal cleavage/methylation domain-containing protein
MDGMTPSRLPRGAAASGGFSLIEVVIAMSVLSVAVLSLVGVFALSMQRMRTSTPMLIAREKAREAIESVHAARDTGEFAWVKIVNVAQGGVFLDGEQPVKSPGNDGLVNTADDGAVETMAKPCKDGILGTGDDEVIPLVDFKRQILITPMNYDGTTSVNPNLRQVAVIIRYKVDNYWREYRLVSYVSSYS